MKKKYSFTIEESLVDWFRTYVGEERLQCLQWANHIY